MRKTFLLSLLVLLMRSSMLLAQAVEVDRFDRTLEQLQRDQRLEANPDIPLGERTFFDYGAYTTVQWLSLDDPQNHNHAFWQEDLVGYAHVIFDGAQEGFFRGRLFHRDFNAGDRFSSDGEDIDGRVDRAFYRFDLANYDAAYGGKQIDGDFSIKIGRDLEFWANGLTLSTELDGGVIDISHGPFSFEFLAGITPIDTVDFDSSRPGFDSHTKRGFYGGMASYKIADQRPFLYVLDQRDYNNQSINASPTDPSVIPTQFEYNSYYIGIGSSGPLSDRFSYGLEGVYEGGDGLSSSTAVNAAGTTVAVAQARNPIEAYAFDGRLDYAIPDAHATRLSLENILATGDSDRGSTTNTVNGNKAGSRDRAFNAFGLLNTGVAFAPPVSNLIVVRLGASTFPFSQSESVKRLQLGTDLFWFGKLNSQAPIDETTSDNTNLGFEPDIYANWAITSDLTLATRYGVFFPGDAFVSDKRARQFFYTGLTLAF